MFLLTVVLFSSCKNDVPIFAEEKEIPIVYCVLSPRDTINYVRINRSSQDAENLDSFEYEENIVITMEELGSNDSYNFDRTDIMNKEVSIIPFKAKQIYKTEGKLNEWKKYKISIYLPEFDLTLSSETNTLGYYSLLEPNPTIERTIDFATDPYYTTQWTACVHAFVYQVFVHFLYSEITNSDTTQKKSIYRNSYVFANGNIRDVIHTDKIYSEPFIIHLGNTIQEKTDVRREVTGVVFEIVAGNEHLATFLNSLDLDISLNNMNLASNIKNGLGVFCSTYSKYTDTLKLSGNTIDSIAYGRHTKNLKFLDRWGNMH
jgi:hypothetical protein